MRIVRHLSDYNARPCVLTIGSFDGIHLGHHALLTELTRLAKLYKLPSVVMSFQPTPNEFFAKTTIKISSFRDKFLQLKKLQIETFILLHFDKKLANMSAENFITEILLKVLNIKHLLIGDDFVFGKNRGGNATLLQKLGTKYHYQLHQLNSILYKNKRVSSSYIRQLLKNGDITSANQLLYRKFSISGKVAHGRQQGRAIGFPTININIKGTSPILGVFVVQVNWQNRQYNGVANIGTRPTIDGGEVLLEVFLFDFNKIIYQQKVRVFFLKKIRDEQKFTDLTALKSQIQTDTKKAKQYFNI